MVNWNLSKHSFCWPVSCDHIVGSSSDLTADQVLVVWKRVDTYPVLKINQIIDFSLSNVFHCFCFVYFDIQNRRPNNIQKSSSSTVLIRRNLTGNANANGNRMDTERVWEQERNGYRTYIERIQNGNGSKNEGKKRSPERKHETMTRGVFSVDKRQQETREDVLIYHTSYPRKCKCLSHLSWKYQPIHEPVKM